LEEGGAACEPLVCCGVRGGAEAPEGDLGELDDATGRVTGVRARAGTVSMSHLSCSYSGVRGFGVRTKMELESSNGDEMSDGGMGNASGRASFRLEARLTGAAFIAGERQGMRQDSRSRPFITTIGS